MLFITDALQYPYDEGFRKFSYYLYLYLTDRADADVLLLNENSHIIDDDKVCYIKTNKGLLSYKLIKKIKPYNYIVYLPISSVSFFSIMRACIIKFFSKSKVVVVGLQERKYSNIQKGIIKKIHNITFVLLNGVSEKIKNIFANTIIIESGVDINKFNIIENPDDIIKIKNKYAIPLNKKIFLHVGHIKKGRNIEELIAIQNRVKDCQVVLVGSTSTECEHELKDLLIDNGIIIIDQYIENISELYNIADCYLFLVKSHSNFISQPLSVLEALACGLPVAAYDYILGNRLSHIKEGIKYFDSLDKIVEFLNNYSIISIKQKKEMSLIIKEHHEWSRVIHDAFVGVFKEN